VRWIENQTSWSIRKFARAVLSHRTIEVQAAPTPSRPPTRSAAVRIAYGALALVRCFVATGRHQGADRALAAHPAR
jgi:hypothetical protein